MSLNSLILTPDIHRDLKLSLARAYPTVPASYRAEALARGLGYRTNASLRADLNRIPQVTADGDAFHAFIRRKYEICCPLEFGSCVAETLFRQIPVETPRWALMPLVDESLYEETWPHYVPYVLANGLGMARAVIPKGFLPPECDRRTAIRQFVKADQSLFDLVPHSGPEDMLSRYFWDISTDAKFTPAALEDGTPLRWIWAGGSVELYELGAYTGGRPWPIGPVGA